MKNKVPKHNKQQESKIIHKFKILYAGWECDNDGWVVEFITNKKRQVFTTSHGSECVMGNRELIAKIRETEDSLDGLKQAAKLIGYVL